MEDHQNGPDGYGEDTETDAVLRQVFLAELEAHNPTLLGHNRRGVELRATPYNLCNGYTTNTRAWIEKYKKYEWDVTVRVQFLFDLQRWVEYLVDLFEE